MSTLANDFQLWFSLARARVKDRPQYPDGIVAAVMVRARDADEAQSKQRRTVGFDRLKFEPVDAEVAS